MAPRAVVAVSETPAPATPTSSCLARLSWVSKLSFPRRYPLVQFPNGPLAVALIAGAVAARLREPAHAYVRSLAYVAMAAWAYEELRSGVNWFRRLLGLAFIVVLTLDVAREIRR